MDDLEKFVEENLDRYDDTQGLMPEFLQNIGEEYREQGYLTRSQLYDIAYESSTRSAYHVKKNTKNRCEEVTENAVKVNGDFSKIHLITGLSGFKAPTASCVLTAYNDERHAVVDTRVWASLERLGYLEERKESFDADDYVTMIRHIRDMSSKTGYTTSQVGYALFAYDDYVRDGTLH